MHGAGIGNSARAARPAGNIRLAGNEPSNELGSSGGVHPLGNGLVELPLTVGSNHVVDSGANGCLRCGMNHSGDVHKVEKPHHRRDEDAEQQDRK